MGYAVKPGQWRAVDAQSDCANDETYYDVLPAPTKAQQLSDAQDAQMGVMLLAYLAAISVSVNFTTAAKVAQVYQADPDSRSKLSDMLNSFALEGQTPAGFYWIAEDDTQVPFTYADLQGLAAVVGAQGWASFQRLQTAKAAINGAKTVAAVQAVPW